MSIYQAYKNYMESKQRNQINIENMSLREIMELTKNMQIKDGGLSILFEKIVSSIEKLEKANEIKSP
jgi:hypothetical protein